MAAKLGANLVSTKLQNPRVLSPWAVALSKTDFSLE
jgi:hypothetical protein